MSNATGKSKKKFPPCHKRLVKVNKGGREWDGREQVNGGYIVVMDNGDILCYHSNDRESFRDYLYRNTYFEYVSANKYKWSRIEKNGSEYHLALNASIRFTTHTR